MIDSSKGERPQGQGSQGTKAKKTVSGIRLCSIKHIAHLKSHFNSLGVRLHRGRSCRKSPFLQGSSCWINCLARSLHVRFFLWSLQGWSIRMSSVPCLKCYFLRPHFIAHNYQISYTLDLYHRHPTSHKVQPCRHTAKTWKLLTFRSKTSYRRPDVFGSAISPINSKLSTDALYMHVVCNYIILMCPQVEGASCDEDALWAAVRLGVERSQWYSEDKKTADAVCRAVKPKDPKSKKNKGKKGDEESWGPLGYCYFKSLCWRFCNLIYVVHCWKDQPCTTSY